MTRRAFFALAWVVPTQRFLKPLAYTGPIRWIVPPRTVVPMSVKHGCSALEELIRETTRRGIESGEFDRMLREMYGR